MRRVFSIAIFAVAFVALGAMSGLRAADEKKDEKPKYSVKEVMKKHQDLVKKVKSDTASAEEKKNLLELYIEMAKNKAPRGDTADWKKVNEALVKATQNVVDAKDGAKDEFEKAADCTKCHNAHKPKK
jgi:uncharacterized protein (DUF342 family)